MWRASNTSRSRTKGENNFDEVGYYDSDCVRLPERLIDKYFGLENFIVKWKISAREGA